jgi:transaldolase
MALKYFQRVAAKTPTRWWVNNPSDNETILAVANGAINCTTNPSFCSKLLTSDRAYLDSVIDEVVKTVEDDDVAADLVYQKTSERIMRRFRPLYDYTHGACGYVTIQADPREDDDADLIIKAALRHRKLGPNYMAKIPVIEAGIAAIETMVKENIPTCATEVFALSQAIYMCERWEAAVKKYGNRPPFFITHITGIFDQHLGNVVKEKKIDITPGILAQAGCCVGRREYHTLKARGYQTTLLGGGARSVQHFTEFIGGDMDITINWSTADELIKADPPAVNRINTVTPKAVIAELDAKIPEFHQAYHEDGLTMPQFKPFGPVQLFRNMFLDGYGKLVNAVKERRARLR